MAMAELRAATWSLHQELERLPASVALAEGRLPLGDYISLLRVFTALHGTLERELQACREPSIVDVWRPDMAKHQLLLQDLLFFRPHLSADPSPLVNHTLQFVSRMRLEIRERPSALLGYLYVLEGSTQGAAVMAPRLAESYGINPGGGLAYFTNYGSDTTAHWHLTGQRFDAVLTDRKELAVVIEAAETSYHFWQEIFTILGKPKQESVTFRSFSLNPEGGDYPVHQDPAVLAAVLRASDCCLLEFPYYLYRYGLRASLFADSDGAWLAQLPGQGERVFYEQLDWLAGVLAARGMPTLLLQRHLEVLSRELLVGCPGGRQDWEQLQGAAQRLADGLSGEGQPLKDQAEKLRRECGLGDNFFSREAALLLLAGLRDARRGLTGADTSLLAWFTNSDHYSARWIAAVEKLVRAGKRG